MSIIRTLAGLFAVTPLLCGCLPILPVDGPARHDIALNATATLANNSGAALYNYALVDLNPAVLECVDDTGGDSLAKTFVGRATRSGRASAVRIGVGDVLQVSVFESSKEGLFSPPEGTIRAGGFVSLPNQAVSSAGTISIPYAGEVHVTGRTVPELEREIENKLAARAVEPQVVITLIEQNAGTVTVLGDAISGSNKLKFSGSGERILDMISKAGGIRFPAFEVFVKIQRKNRVATVYFPRLVDSPEENIFVEPGDLIFIYRDQRRYVAVGAIGASGGGASIAGNNTLVGAVGQFSFDQEHLSLNEAIAKAGGILDGRADPTQVFLYRIEPRETLERMGVDMSKFLPNQKMIPTIYRANFRDPSSFFYTQRFPMRHKDVIYVGNANSVEHEKLFGYLNDLTGTMAGVATNLATVINHGP